MAALRASLKAHRLLGAACWASYLINGDASGLDDAELAICDAWLVARKLENREFVDVGEPFFSWHFGHATGHACKGGAVAEYTYLA